MIQIAPLERKDNTKVFMKAKMIKSITKYFIEKKKATI